VISVELLFVFFLAIRKYSVQLPRLVSHLVVVGELYVGVLDSLVEPACVSIHRGQLEGYGPRS